MRLRTQRCYANAGPSSSSSSSPSPWTLSLPLIYYSMGQIIKSLVSVLSVCLFVRPTVVTPTIAIFVRFWWNFEKKVMGRKSKNEFVRRSKSDEPTCPSVGTDQKAAWLRYTLLQFHPCTACSVKLCILLHEAVLLQNEGSHYLNHSNTVLGIECHRSIDTYAYIR